MVPQAKELEPLLGTLAAAGYGPKGLTLGRLDCHCFDELGLLFAVGGHGKTQLAVQTQHLIEQRHTVQSVICAGAAGSLDGQLRLGDIVVGTSTVDVIVPVRARELQAETGAVCVAWEGAGAARAARFSGLRFLELRAITDGADHAAAAEFQANLARSMPSLGHLLLRWSLGRVRP
jgi:adenosylhomocysteine nucleosidase